MRETRNTFKQYQILFFKNRVGNNITSKEHTYKQDINKNIVNCIWCLRVWVLGPNWHRGSYHEMHAICTSNFVSNTQWCFRGWNQTQNRNDHHTLQHTVKLNTLNNKLFPFAVPPSQCHNCILLSVPLWWWFNDHLRSCFVVVGRRAFCVWHRKPHRLWVRGRFSLFGIRGRFPRHVPACPGSRCCRATCWPLGVSSSHLHQHPPKEQGHNKEQYKHAERKHVDLLWRWQWKMWGLLQIHPR